MDSEISGHQLIKPFAAASVNLHRGGVYQIPVRIEGAQKSCLIGLYARLNSLQCIFTDEKRSLHRTIMPQNRTARSVASYERL